MSETRPDWAHDHEYDCGQPGCGELLVVLKLHFDPLPPRTRVLLRSGAEESPTEIPLWCGLAGHRLLEASHPYYLIQRRS